jgi:hypothetical protein
LKFKITLLLMSRYAKGHRTENSRSDYYLRIL